MAGIIAAKTEISRTRACGEWKHLGPRIDSATEQAIRAALAEGKGIRKVARECGVGVSVAQRIAAERPAGELPSPA